jgi:replicative DNA helicase
MIVKWLEIQLERARSNHYRTYTKTNRGYSDRQIEKLIDGEQDVYDMQVAHPDHNFLATDVIAHNSHALSLLALYYAVTQENKRIIVFTPSQPQLEEFFMKKINGWIRTNPIFSEMIDDTETQRDSPYPIRSFITGSTIQGFILGTKEGAQEGKRGLTADILILDEAQEYSKGDWAVVGAIMGGDTHRRKNKGVKTFIAGTIRQPDGYFFQKIKKLDIDPKNESRIFIPIDQNLDETPESVAHLKSITPPDIWNNEWMLELGDEEDTIFPKDDVMAGGFQDWEYGPKMIDYSPITRMPGEHVRFIGVDWDRVGAGTNIAVVQYDPFMRQMFTIDRIEVPRGQFTYYDACERMFDLYETYKPMLIVSDAGAGDMQWQYMWMEAGKKGMYEMQNRLIKLALNSKIDIPNPTTEEVDHVYIKPVLVGMLQKKLQERKWFYPAHDEDLKLQLLTYKKLRETVNTIKFSSNNEHIIDCHLFAVWGIWEMFESPFRDTSETQLAVRKLGVDKLSFRDDEQAMADFWDGLAGRQPVMGQRSNLWSEHPWGGSGGDQQGFNRPLSENFGRRNSLDRWLMD